MDMQSEHQECRQPRRRTFSRRQLLASAAVASAALPATFSLASAATSDTAVRPSLRAAQDKVQLKFMSRGGEYIKGVVDKQIAAFNQTYPDIEIKQDSAAGDFVQKIQLDAAAGNLPDAWFDANRTTGPFWHGGLIENLEPHIKADSTFVEDDFIPQAFIAQTYEGDRWGLPWDSGAMALIYNIDMLNEAGVPLPDTKTPMTWEELLDAAKKLTVDLNGKKPGEDGFDPSGVKQYGFQPDLTNGLPQWLQTNEAEIIQPDPSGENPLISPIDTPEAIEAFQFLADLGTTHFVSPSPAYVQSSEISLQSSTVAISHNGVWQMGRLNDAGINWGVAPFPIRKKQISYGHYSPLVISSKSEHKDETFTWVRWATTSKEGEEILVETGTQQPIRKDLTDPFINSETPPPTEYRQVFYDAWSADTFRWPGDSIGSYWNGWCQQKNDLWATELDPLWSGKVTYEEIASDFRGKTESVLRTGKAR